MQFCKTELLRSLEKGFKYLVTLILQLKYHRVSSLVVIFNTWNCGRCKNSFQELEHLEEYHEYDYVAPEMM